jgi:LmbE family N-acetylglucosaminyl deacetylase
MNIEKIFAGKRPTSLRKLRIPKRLKVLYLAPHPDDFDAVSIAMRWFKDNKNPILIAIVSSGASGVEDSYCASASWQAKADIREREQAAACRFFGLDANSVTFLRLDEDRNGHPVDSENNRERLRQYFFGVRPDIVCLPHGHDTNTGHQRVYSIFRQMATDAGYPLVALLNRDPKTILMRTDLYITFGKKDAGWKGNLLRFHQSQHQRNLNTRRHGFDDRILTVNKQIGDEVRPGKNLLAEGFELEYFGLQLRQTV